MPENGRQIRSDIATMAVVVPQTIVAMCLQLQHKCVIGCHIILSRFFWSRSQSNGWLCNSAVYIRSSQAVYHQQSGKPTSHCVLVWQHSVSARRGQDCAIEICILLLLIRIMQPTTFEILNCWILRCMENFTCCFKVKAVILGYEGADLTSLLI